MGDFLNIIIDDLDDIEGKHFYKKSKWSGDEKIDLFLKDIFDFHGFTKWRKCTFEEAKKNPEENYFYFIVSLHHLEYVYDEYLTIPLKKELVDYIRDFSNINVVIYNNNEVDNFYSFQKLDFYIKTENLNPTLFYFANNDANLEDYKIKLESEINVFSSRDLTLQFMKMYSIYNSPLVLDKKFLFTCYNGTPKLHRYALLSLIKHSEFMESVDWSLRFGHVFRENNIRKLDNKPDYHFFQNLFNLNQIVDMKDSIDYFCSIDVKKPDNEIDVFDKNYDYVDANSFTNAYVQIVTESHYNNIDVHMTEKTFKPFYFYQIPIFLATKNHVKKLRERYPQLDLFDDIIDHSFYDGIENDSTRLAATFEQIKKLYENRNYIKEFYKKNKDRLEKNRQVIIDIVNNDKSEFDFFNNLITKKKDNFYFNIIDRTEDANEYFRTDKEIIDNTLKFYRVQNLKYRKIEDVSEFAHQNHFLIYINSTRIEYAFPKIDSLLSDDVINLLKSNRNVYVLLINEYEPETFDALNLINNYIKNLGIDTKQVFFINNNLLLEDYKKRVGSEINLHKINRLAKIHVDQMKRADSSKFIENKEFLFMSHNRMVKPHRYALLILLKHFGILDVSDWSALKNFNFINDVFSKKDDTLNYFFRKFFDNDDIEKYKESINYFSTFDIKKSKYEENYVFDTNSNVTNFFDYDQVFKLNPYKHSYINLVNETLFDEEYIIHITDKSFIPFYFYQIPIFLATTGHVKKLKEHYNLDLFEDLIDHSYDEIEDTKLRFFAIIEEIKRLNENKNVVFDFYKNNRDRFEKNKKIAEALIYDLTDHSFFKKLINFKNEF
jgi:hypothetical protein